MPASPPRRRAAPGLIVVADVAAAVGRRRLVAAIAAVGGLGAFECWQRVAGRALFPTGVDVEMVVDGAPFVGRTFATTEDAFAFSEELRREWAVKRAEL
jgi:hypothetical protein